jgi:ankyrin repeat protein
MLSSREKTPLETMELLSHIHYEFYESAKTYFESFLKFNQEKDLKQCLLYAVTFGDYWAAKYLIEEHKVDATQVRTLEDENLLSCAALYFDKQKKQYIAELIELLINSRVPHNEPNQVVLATFISGTKAYQNAGCREEFLNTIRLMVRRKIDINAQSQRGQTALMVAAEEGDKEVCFLLMELGADITLRDKGNATAISIAFFYNHVSLAKDLIQYVKDKKLNLTVALGTSFISVRLDVKLVTFLAEHHADPNLRDSFGLTALHRVASELNHQIKDEKTQRENPKAMRAFTQQLIAVTEVLLKSGADPLIKNIILDELGDYVEHQDVLNDAISRLEHLPEKYKVDGGVVERHRLFMTACISTLNRTLGQEIYRALATNGLFPRPLIHLVQQYVDDNIHTEESQTGCCVIM